MKRIFVTFFLALICVSLAQAIEVGDAAEEVNGTLGKAVAILKKADGTEVWRFKNGTTIWMAEGTVQKITGPSIGNSMRRNGAAAWVPVKNPPAKVPVAVNNDPDNTSPADEPGSGLGYLVLFGGLALGLVVADLLRTLVTFLRNSLECLWSSLVVPFAASISSALAEGRSRIKRV